MNSASKPNFRKKIYYFCILLTVAWVGYVATLSPVESLDGSNLLIAKVKSPDGKLLALVHETNGGATTGFGYLVSIRPSYTSKKMKEFWWAPLAKEVAYFYSPSSQVQVCWSSPNTLDIQYLDCERDRISEVVKEVAIGEQQIHVHLISGIADDNVSSAHSIIESYARSHKQKIDPSGPYGDKLVEQAFTEFTDESYIPALNFSPFLAKTAYLINESWTPPHEVTRAHCEVEATICKNGSSENVHLKLGTSAIYHSEPAIN